MTSPGPATRPLHGVRVVDLTTMISGPMLGEHAAEISSELRLAAR